MTYNPDIAAARRAAKQMARETGAAYQASLDTVARSAGRSDWDDYLLSPTAMPVQDDQDLYVNGPEHAHNMKTLWITAVATLPSMFVMPLAFSKRGGPVSGLSDYGMIPTTMDVVLGWSKVIGLGIGLWMIAACLGTMFFDMLAVHPDAPEPGREGKRVRHTSVDLARMSIAMSLLALVISLLMRDHEQAQLTAVVIAAGLGMVAGSLSLLVHGHMTKRVLALVAANGMCSSAFLMFALMPR